MASSTRPGSTPCSRDGTSVDAGLSSLAVTLAPRGHKRGSLPSARHPNTLWVSSRNLEKGNGRDGSTVDMPPKRNVGRDRSAWGMPADELGAAPKGMDTRPPHPRTLPPGVRQRLSLRAEQNALPEDRAARAAAGSSGRARLSRGGGKRDLSTSGSAGSSSQPGSGELGAWESGQKWAEV